MTDYGRPLEGKVALITGGSRGLGAAAAKRLSRWGARIIVTYRQQEAAALEVVEECAALTPGASAVQMDLLDEESVRHAFAGVTEDEDRLDFLVANAAATALK
ncbi:MAG: SDR family NAD(P)-dependent oxidoreductase, partial [Deltaproteobacteria bacterium]|nr:SDR family NAD(P)-dependent oxidoreductase [Deltaproteobacteria bacterium]